MDPKIWGPKLWFVSHSVAFNYPENPTENDKQTRKQWFALYKDIIMCDVCKQHYREHWDKNPIDPYLKNRDGLIKWVWMLHNSVNESIGKNKWSFEQMMEHYSNIFGQKCTINTSNKCTQKPNNNNQHQANSQFGSNFYILLTMNLVIVLILFLIYKKNIVNI